MRAVRGVRKFGHSADDMGRHYDVSGRSIRNWLGRFDERGAAGLQNRPKSGRPPAVNMSRMKNIAKHMSDRGELTTAAFRDEVHRKTGTKFHLSYARRVLRKFGFAANLPDAARD